MKTLEEFEDAQAAMLLLRSSFGSVRATHFMRTTPLPNWAEAAGRFDDQVKDTAQNIIGQPFLDHHYKQATLAARKGGLGLRRASDHADGAYAASWQEASGYVRSLSPSEPAWEQPPHLKDKAFGPKQKDNSLAIDEEHLRLLLQNPSHREQVRLKRLQEDHANAWVSAIPTSPETTMDPHHFRVAVKRLLGMFIVRESYPCPMCQQTIDRFGDHAISCQKSGDLIFRHNRVRDYLFKLGQKCLLAPEREKLGLLGDGDVSQRRPGDVSFPRWGANKGAAVDVAVISQAPP